MRLHRSLKKEIYEDKKSWDEILYTEYDLDFLNDKGYRDAPGLYIVIEKMLYNYGNKVIDSKELFKNRLGNNSEGVTKSIHLIYTREVSLKRVSFRLWRIV